MNICGCLHHLVNLKYYDFVLNYPNLYSFDGAVFNL